MCAENNKRPKFYKLLDYDENRLVMYTAAHELTHHMKSYAKDSFNKFADSVLEAIGEGKAQELVEKRISELRRGGRLDGLIESQTYDLAYEEVVADAAERMLTDSDALERLAGELKSKDKNLWQKVKDYISSLVKKIKDANARLNSDSYEGRKLKEVAKDYDAILKIWSDAVVEMSRTEDAADNSETTSENLNNVRYSFRNSESGMANDALLPYNEELTKYIEQNGGFIVDSFDKLKEIVNLAFDNPNRKGTAYFGIINTDTLEKIKNSIPNLPQANKDVLFKKEKDYSIATTLDAIRHIVDEKNLTREDVIDYLDRFADTIVEFDSVAFNYYDRGTNKLSGLLFKKRFDDGILVSFDIVSHKKRSVVLQTLYMDSADYQKKKAAETLLMQNAHSNTSKTQVGQPSNSSVSQQSENINRKFSDRSPAEDSFSNRSLLANALESVAQSLMEKQKLAEYKAKIRELNVQSRKLYEINQEIYELTFGGVKKDSARLKALREEAVKTANRINLYDKKLLQLEATKPLRDVLERETKKAYKRAAEKGKEALHRNVEDRHKTEARHKIQRIAKELDVLLNRGIQSRAHLLR